MDRAMELMDYWNENPPAHELMFSAWFERKYRRRYAPDVDKALLETTFPTSGATKVSAAPAHIRASIEAAKAARAKK